MKRIAFDDPEIAHYISEHAGCTYDPIRDHCAGIVDDGPLDSTNKTRVKGGVLWTNYTHTSMMIHMAGEQGWCTRDMLWTAFHYPFVQLGCVELYAVLESANETALKINLGLGFEVILVRPRMFASGAGLLLCMEREACRWLKIKPRSLKGN